MTLDHDAAYQVFKARDARFDGRLFVGVTSTGIYCRPVCRVRTPRKENCRFFDTPAQAEAEAFRPCMKCRPEVAPGPGLAWTVMDASRTLARQAAHWLDARLGTDDDGSDSLSMAALASHLGVSDRHLRRIFAAEHGVTPLQYLQTRRLLLAKQLLTDTRLPVAQVALASGFRSLRRFNAAFADSYRMSPSRLRADADEPDALPQDEALCVNLGYRAPYDTTAMLRFLALRAIPEVEHVDGLRVRRSLRAGALAPAAGWLEAAFMPETPTRAPRVHLQFAPSLAPHAARIVAGVRRWLDLDASPDTIDEALSDLPGEPGLRLPGCVDSFEMVVRAVLGQQVTVAAARTLARRFADRFGEPIATPWPEVTRTFPSPDAVAAAKVEQIAELGIIRTRAGAIQALAQAWPEASRHLHDKREPEALIAMLKTLPGIGPWTAHYIAMRALSWPDAFPPNDVAVLNAIEPLFGTTTQREADALAERWRPWRAYAVLRLWNSLA
ncbi:MAG: DNA-3-methyladenine glycosylase 2 family protein [Rhizobacter sp.]|nr:DNA-3-methyladenine glycosylase 2 family protein [Rhizobacter sp.]